MVQFITLGTMRSALSGFQVAAVCECLRLPCRRIRLALVVSRVAELVFAKTFLTERPFKIAII